MNEIKELDKIRTGKAVESRTQLHMVLHDRPKLDNTVIVFMYFYQEYIQ